MKRNAIVSALMIPLGLLTACGGSSLDEEFESLRTPMAAAETMTITGTVTARYPDRTDSYTLTCSGQKDHWTLTVLAPEEIAGITATISGKDSALEYDGAILAAGDLTASGITPIRVLPVTAEALVDGWADSFWTENDCLTAKLIYDDQVAVTIWFDEANTPKAAELSENGSVRAACTIESWRTEGSDTNGRTEETDLGGDQPGESGT